MANNHIIVGLGELLWDMLPSGKQLGGAPANFAYHTQMLGNQGIIASRVGPDDLGKEILSRLGTLKLKTEYIQTDELTPTGTVTVEVKEKSQPLYTITEEVAWDYLEWTDQWETLAKQAKAVCFGSLAQRTTQSRLTMRRFLRAMTPGAMRIFDVNLRQMFYSTAIVHDSLLLADIAKLNEQELPQVMRVLGLKSSNLKANVRTLLETYGLKMVCLTRGHLGCMLANEKQVIEHQGFKVRVADAVGAGDAFTAAMVHHFLKGSSLEKTAQAANRLGSYVASQSGATPQIDKNILNQVL
ncbi:MAG: carbohydrate kinase [Sedimentisphaerales bacterium]|nr:carbohydrate kinase [Sedimentisphaerales bacterium]